MKLGWLGFALVIGMLIPAQAAINAKMRTFVISPFYSALINFAVGASALIIISVILFALNQSGDWRGSLSAPWWAWLGGFIGASMVLAGVLVIPHTGAAAFSVTLVTGNLIGAILIDHFGMLGLIQRSISPSRLAGLILMLIGIWLVQRR